MLGRTGGISPPRDPEKGDGGSTGGGGGGEWVDDVTPQSLADPDSRFMECGAVTVHLKEALPPVRPLPCNIPSVQHCIQPASLCL